MYQSENNSSSDSVIGQLDCNVSVNTNSDIVNPISPGGVNRNSNKDKYATALNLPVVAT